MSAPETGRSRSLAAEQASTTDGVSTLGMTVALVLSGALSRELSKKAKADIRIVSVTMGVLYSYLLANYGLETSLGMQITEIVPTFSELAAASFLATTAMGIEYRK